MTRSLRIAAIEPFFGGSHKAFLEGYRKFSRHQVEIFSLPARKWKWRMRGAALHFAEQLRDSIDSYGVIFVSDFLSLADLVALRPEAASKAKVVYFHENQLTYPCRDEAERDYQFAFTNITTCLAADMVLFNSAFHRRSFLDALGPFLRRMPDFRPEGVVSAIEAKSWALHFGVDLSALRSLPRKPREGPPLILWNHRWEFDKNPEAFFEALLDLQSREVGFRVAVVGERYQCAPEIFEKAEKRLGERVVQFAWLGRRADYLRLLRQSDIVASTAIHEFFGVAVVEAIAAGCWPLLPNRLSYPELIPPERHREHLYDSDEEFRRKLLGAIERVDEVRRGDLRGIVEPFSWERLVGRYDQAMCEAAESR